MKVLFIDPWATVGGTAEYTNGILYGISKFVDVDLYTNAYFVPEIKLPIKIHKVFFKLSHNMKKNIVRKCIRGIEYVWAYLRIILYVSFSKKKVDAIHINWLLNYKMDYFFLKILKKKSKKIVYTAHNVIPHIDGEKYVDELEKIYSVCDKIILHGEEIKKEFESYFPKYIDNIYIQKHGMNIKPEISFSVNDVPMDIRNKIEGYDRVILYFGTIFYNKGVDRLVKSWNSNWKNALLVIAGRQDESFTEMKLLKDYINKTNNIFTIDEIVPENTLRYLITKCDIVFLPYRHASMSGVIFTAADYKKTVVCTKVGAIPEYLHNHEDCFLIDNDDNEISTILDEVVNKVTKEELVLLGKNMYYNLKKTCSWDKLGKNVVQHCYSRDKKEGRI